MINGGRLLQKQMTYGKMMTQLNTIQIQYQRLKVTHHQKEQDQLLVKQLSLKKIETSGSKKKEVILSFV